MGAAVPRRRTRARAGAGARGLPWYSDQRRRAAACGVVGSVHPDAARVAMPSAFGRLHLARPVAPAHLEGGRPGIATGDGMARRVAAIGGPLDLHGRPSPSVAE